ncbi:MAG: sialidase family protein [Bacteroidota bacterium]
MKNWRFKETLVAGIVLSLILTTGCTINTPVQKPLNYLFESGTEGYHTFRIPAIVTTTEGTVLAFAEGRKDGGSDTGDIDLVMKRSEDNGKTWSELLVIRDDGENVCGNPAPVVDKSRGTIHLLSTWNLGNDSEKEIIDGESKDTRRVFVMRSDDDGLTWSEPEEITSTVKREQWTWYATGPCHGIQLNVGAHRGRLLIPCDHIEAGSKKYFSHTIYSDDHGETWELGGTTPQDQVNECTVAELSDGRLMLNMRNYDRSQKSRKIAFSEDGGVTWSDIFADTTLIEPICQASLLLFSHEKEEKHTLLFLNPADENKRQMMTLRSSGDEGSTWRGSLVLHEGPSAYSDLTRLSNGNLGCLYEAGNSTPYQGIVFQEIPWQQLEKAALN